MARGQPSSTAACTFGLASASTSPWQRSTACRWLEQRAFCSGRAGCGRPGSRLPKPGRADLRRLHVVAIRAQPRLRWVSSNVLRPARGCGVATAWWQPSQLSAAGCSLWRDQTGVALGGGAALLSVRRAGGDRETPNDEREEAPAGNHGDGIVPAARRALPRPGGGSSGRSRGWAQCAIRRAAVAPQCRHLPRSRGPLPYSPP
jgi:hypothetical protein